MNNEIRVASLGISNGKWGILREELCRQRLHEITEKLLTTEYGSEEYRKLQLELLTITM